MQANEKWNGCGVPSRRGEDQAPLNEHYERLVRNIFWSMERIWVTHPFEKGHMFTDVFRVPMHDKIPYVSYAHDNNR